MQRSHPVASDRPQRHGPELGHKYLRRGATVRHGRVRLAAHGHVLPQVPLACLRQRGALGRCGAVPVPRLLTCLDTRDQRRCLLPRLLRGQNPVPPDHDPSRLSAPPRLHQVHIAPRRVDPNPEPRQIPVPEHRILVFHRQTVNRIPPTLKGVPIRGSTTKTDWNQQGVRQAGRLREHREQRCSRRMVMYADTGSYMLRKILDLPADYL